MMLTEATACIQTAIVTIALAFLVGIALGILSALEFMRNK